MTWFTDDELAAHLRDLESQWVERKRSAADRSGIRRNICAFANDLAGGARVGVIFVGLEDDGRCAGLDIDDQLLGKLAQMRRDGNILPIPSMQVERKVLEQCPLAVIQVEPAANPPVRYQAQQLRSLRLAVGDQRGLYGRVTPANIDTGTTDYRNPLIAEIMRHLGFAQRFGIGLPIARQALQDNGNPPPEFAFSPTHVTVIVRPAT